MEKSPGMGSQEGILVKLFLLNGVSLGRIENEEKEMLAIMTIARKN